MLSLDVNDDKTRLAAICLLAQARLPEGVNAPDDQVAIKSISVDVNCIVIGTDWGTYTLKCTRCE